MSSTTPHTLTFFALIGLIGFGGCSLILDDPAAAPPPVCPAQGCEDGQTDNAQGGDNASNNDNNQTGSNNDAGSNNNDNNNNSSNSSNSNNSNNSKDPLQCDPACAEGEQCFRGRCVAAFPCAGDAACAGSAVCSSDGLCRPLNGFPCDVAADCPSPSACQQTAQCLQGICVYSSTDGERCDDGDPCTSDDTCLIEPGSQCIGVPRCTGVTSACSVEDRAFVITYEKCDPQSATCLTEEEHIPCEGCAANCAADCSALSCDAPGIDECVVRGCVQNERFARCEVMSAPEGTPCLGLGGQTWSCRGGVCSGCSGDSASCVFEEEAPENKCLKRLCETTEDGEACRIVPKDGECDDGDPCTSGDTCAEGLCVGAPKDCGGTTCRDGRCVECQRDWDCDGWGITACNSISCRDEVCVREPNFEGWPCGLFRWCDNGSCR